MAFAAHVDDKGRRHDLVEHLEGTAQLARGFASAFGAGEWGRLLGLWHDVGKYSQAFQDYLLAAGDRESGTNGQSGRVDHSTAGAQLAVNCMEADNPVAARVLAYCIAGHHAGLADWQSASDGCLAVRLKQRKPQAADALARAKPDLLGQAAPPMPQLVAEGSRSGMAFQAAMYTRMLYSCLADADFLDTERFMRPDRSIGREPGIPDVAQLEEVLGRFLDDMVSRAMPTPVNQRRCEVLKACRAACWRRPGFFSLTVPTGGGKTLSSLAFALGHARAHGLRRVIYALPFTTIIEQNVEAFRAALGVLAPTAVVEHHSNLDPIRETVWNRLASENWDAPVVVTTNVQLFESVFANRTSRCRRLHNLVRAVIVLDEAQVLPVEFLAPCLSALRELVTNYGCTVLLCTATQPAVHRRPDFPLGLDDVREIAPEPQRLYSDMRRVQLRPMGLVTDVKLAELLAAERQVLCVVNTKRHARELYGRLPQDGGTFHLSAWMCPRHRSAVIRAVKRRLRSGRTCRLVSTQLIEAGVDIDFPIVYRAMAGLDSIAQAAGRCNREGRLTTGQVYVFDASEPPPPGHLRQTAETARELVGLFDDLLGLEAMDRYFQLHYWKRQDAWDRYGILDCFGTSRRGEPICDFRRAAEAFRLIQDQTQPVVIPWKRRGRTLVDRLRLERLPDRATRRAMQRYTVSVYARDWDRLWAGGCLELLHEQFPVLTDMRCYRGDTGLSPGEEILIV